MPRKEGEFLVEDFYVNNGGLNTADSPFVVSLSEAAGGKNFDYVKRGGAQKRAGHDKLNSSADSLLKSIGLGFWNKPGTARKVMRAAGTKFQNFDTNAYTFTNLTEDTAAAGSDFFTNGSTQPVVYSMFNTSSVGVLWSAGGGQSAGSLYGAYSGTKVTKNGVPELAVSSFTATASGAGGTGTLATGTYRYTLVFRKSSTQALGNASTSVEASATFTNGTHDHIALSWTVSNNDTTKYDKIYIYRSAVNGAAGFTAGALVTIVNSNVTSHNDTGASTSSSETVPRAGSTSLDNSVLGSNTYNCVTLFKRRLVVASGSSVYFSDINKPESWPTYQTITVPSGGDITALGVISLTNPASSEIQEMLCVFKQRELWIITGDGTISSGIPDWSLKFINTAGAPNQAVVVQADGQLLWLSYRGPHMWNGSGKPRFIGRKIKDKFQRGGDVDKSKLAQAWGIYVENRSEVHWCISSKSEGTQKYVLKLDLEQTTSGGSDALGNASIDGIFTPDVLGFAAYSALSFIAADNSTEETIYYGDDLGFIYSAYTGVQDGTTSFDFEYLTSFLPLGTPTKAKRVVKVVAWVLDNGQYDFRLSFWSNFRYTTTDASVVTVTVNQGVTNTGAIYGEAIYGTDTYNSFSPKIKPVVFNLTSIKNNCEGDSFRFKFAQAASTRTLTLYGFSIYYTELASRN